MDLEDLALSLLIWKRELDLAIDTSRPDQRWVQRFHLVGRHDDFDIASGVETIELVEELEHRALNFLLTAG